MHLSSVSRLLTRFLCFSAVLICSAFSELYAQPISHPAQKPRIEIALFKYEGIAKGQLSEEKYGMFLGIIKGKLKILRNEIPQTKIHIKSRGNDTFDIDQEVYHWIENQTNVLSVLRGTIASDDNINYTVHSRFFLRRFRAYLPYEEVIVELPIKEKEFKNTIDSHTLVILYALAMDVKRLGYPKDQIALYLKSAINIILDLESKRSLSGDLTVLKNAIQTATDELLGSK